MLVADAGQEVDTVSLLPVATFSKPIALTDLSQFLEKLAGPKTDRIFMDVHMLEINNPKSLADVASQLMWTTDVSKAAQQLTQLTLESSAQAAFITHQNELWAYAGQLSREAAQELTESIQRYWNNQGESDLLRFVRLQATEAQHMLYVRKLSEEMTLALVFDAETPFSTIRSQAGKLVKNLFDGSNSETSQPSAMANLLPQSVSSYNNSENDYLEIPQISELLGEVPPPNPPIISLKINLPWDQPVSTVSTPPFVAKEGNKPFLNETRDSFSTAGRDLFNRPTPAMDETFATTPITSFPAMRAAILGEGTTGDLQVTHKQTSFATEGTEQIGSQAATESVVDGAHRILLESPSLSHVNLTYACLLIPRFEHHHLVGDVSVRLNEWVPQLCVAFGWRLEFISVRPDYLQWIARVPLNTAPGYVINIIRKHTSERFFAEFPRFKVDNPSGQFWAHGFIVQGGSQPHPQKQIHDFIEQTRMRQGLR